MATQAMRDVLTICEGRVGYAGQRYEVRALDHELKERVIGWTNEGDGGALTAMVNKHPSWHSPKVVDLKPFKIFQMNDCDWVAALTLEEAKLFYLEFTRMHPDDAFPDGDEPYEVAAERLLNLRYCDEDGSRRSFREELDRQIAEDAKFPMLFASTEY